MAQAAKVAIYYTSLFIGYMFVSMSVLFVDTGQLPSYRMYLSHSYYYVLSGAFTLIVYPMVFWHLRDKNSWYVAGPFTGLLAVFHYAVFNLHLLHEPTILRAMAFGFAMWTFAGVFAYLLTRLGEEAWKSRLRSATRHPVNRPERRRIDL